MCEVSSTERIRQSADLAQPVSRWRIDLELEVGLVSQGLSKLVELEGFVGEKLVPWVAVRAVEMAEMAEVVEVDNWVDDRAVENFGGVEAGSSVGGSVDKVADKAEAPRHEILADEN